MWNCAMSSNVAISIKIWSSSNRRYYMIVDRKIPIFRKVLTSATVKYKHSTNGLFILSAWCMFFRSDWFASWYRKPGMPMTGIPCRKSVLAYLYLKFLIVHHFRFGWRDTKTLFIATKRHCRSFTQELVLYSWLHHAAKADMEWWCNLHIQVSAIIRAS